MAVLVEADELAVDHQRRAAEIVREVFEFRELGIERQLVARDELVRAGFADRADRADAVPLDFEEPAIVVERLVDERRQHRLLDGWDLRASHAQAFGAGGRYALPDVRYCDVFLERDRHTVVAPVEAR